MDCIKIICLYLKNYITIEQFENLFMDSMEDFQECLSEDIYMDILSTNLRRKDEKIRLDTLLRDYIYDKYLNIYESINDSYIEKMIDSGESDATVAILKKNCEKAEEIVMDCSNINTQSELIAAFKKLLQYPRFCGDNWDAIEDLIFDSGFPRRLIFSKWYEMEKRLPADTLILKEILERNNDVGCVILFT